jgi:hypothetical protein
MSGASSTRPVRLGVRLSEAARKHLLRHLQAYETIQPFLGLLGSGGHGARAERWSLVAYSTEQVRTMEAEYLAFGAQLIFDLDGISVALPQLHLRRQLEGKAFDIIDGELRLVASLER